MIKWLKVDKNVYQLNDTQAFVYYLILYSVKERRLINRSYIMNCLQLTSLDYVTEIVRALKDKGFIKVNYHNYGFSYDKYDVQYVFDIPPMDSWFAVDYSLLNPSIPAKVRGFAIRYRSLAYDDTLQIKMTKTEIARTLDMSRTTLNVRLDWLKAYNLSPETFPKLNCVNLTDEESEILTILTKERTPKNRESKQAKQAKWYLENEIYKTDKDRTIYMQIVSGTFKLSKNAKICNTKSTR